jgi:hypothetical protein
MSPVATPAARLPGTLSFLVPSFLVPSFLVPSLAGLLLAGLACHGAQPPESTVPAAPPQAAPSQVPPSGVSAPVSPVPVVAAPDNPPPATSPDAPVIQTLFVRDQRVACQGEVPMQCLQVRNSEAEEWRNFYASIEGFNYEDAHAYELRVEVTRLPNPPMDASSLRYRLLEIVTKRKRESSPKP